MKRNLLLTILILVFVIPCAAQGNSRKSESIPKVQKFGEILFGCGTEISMRMSPLIKALRKKPAAKAYVIVYAPNFMAENAQGLLNFARLRFEEAKIAPNRIVLLEGGIRLDLTTELFLVPKGALPPVPNPTVNEKSVTLKP